MQEFLKAFNKNAILYGIVIYVGIYIANMLFSFVLHKIGNNAFFGFLDQVAKLCVYLVPGLLVGRKVGENGLSNGAAVGFLGRIITLFIAAFVASLGGKGMIPLHEMIMGVFMSTCLTGICGSAGEKPLRMST
jgi:hypothetical protein